MKTYYQILGVNESASAAEINAAFRSKAHQFHPDVNKSPNAEVTFKELNRIYSALNDAVKRAEHDDFIYMFRTVTKETAEFSDLLYASRYMNNQSPPPKSAPNTNTSTQSGVNSKSSTPVAQSSKPKPYWVWLVIGGELAFHTWVYLSGGYTDRGFAIGLVLHALALFVSAYIYPVFCKKLSDLWSSIGVLYAVHILILFILIPFALITDSNTKVQHSSSATLRPLPTRTATVRIAERAVTATKVKIAENILSGIPPANTQHPTVTPAQQDTRFYDGNWRNCIPAPSSVPHPFISYVGYTEKELKDYGYSPNSAGNYSGMYKSEDGNYHFIGERRPLMHITEYYVNAVCER